MSVEESKNLADAAISRFEKLPTGVRSEAYKSLAAYANYIYAVASGGAGPVALPPPVSGGSSPSTKGTFKCPSCGHNGTATFT